MLIDNNVWSELVKPNSNPGVVRFIADNSRRMFLSVIVVAEIEFGIANAVDPAHKRRLGDWLENIIIRCEDRILTPDFEVAAVWGKLKAMLERRGEPIADMDLLIASQALAAGIPLVTRNVSDMARTGATIINPWDS